MQETTNFHRARKFGKEYLITNDVGDHMFLDSEEYRKFKSLNYDGELKNRLRENGFLISEDNSKEFVDKTKKKKSFLFQGPSLHIIIPTLRCDLKCVYCHASSKPQDLKGYDMDEATAKKAVDRMFESPSKDISIEFQGGEPLLNFEIVKLVIEYAKEKNQGGGKNLKISIVTNLTHMDDEKLEFLINNDVSICTSLDGPKKLHDKNRQDYDSVVEWVDKINKKYGERGLDKRMNALITITRDSLKYPKEIIDEYLKHGFKSIHLRGLNTLGNAKQSLSDISYSAEEYLDFWKKCMDYIIELNKRGEYFHEVKALIMLKKIFDEQDPNYCELRSPCGAVTGQMVYNHDGNVYTCDEGRMVDEELFNIGTVDNSFKELTTCPTACTMISSSINDTRYCDRCVYKPYCGVCPVLNYAISGSIIGNIPGSDWCKIHTGQFDYIFEKLKDEETKKVFMKWLEKEGIY